MNMASITQLGSRSSNLMETSERDSSSSSSSEPMSWITWFCSRAGHEFFVEIKPEFIEDPFNLTGLSMAVPFYREALELILDRLPTETLEHIGVEVLETSAQVLYGLIHQRFILTRTGLHMMAEKYTVGHFGCCPRVYCNYIHTLPCGRSDIVGLEPVMLFCPNCLDIYTPSSSRYRNVDGAFFGTTFAHLFFQTYPELRPKRTGPSGKVYEPRIYGFKISEYSTMGPRMQWLRLFLSDTESSERDSS
ncbi:CK2 family regulatory subunit [Schizosaccharomyces japonicus yFS275]|uniref:Casein kinase II subunit beta n=1 Tax=Schizosaccharomyces japonicus (strain yFS275 / FY16936) TaxID=402676 RepID=B6K5F6_SCHJY|nr:CK2 family regulatory subunit [Schizosaccharomyces japonicus yFS275]EEB08760.2 CK2 family regulatory subunit [Schizosaccharomyces japonicus yFS275]